MNNNNYNYDQLDFSIQSSVLAARDNIRLRIKNIEQDVLSIGAELLSVRAMLPHGQFTKWIEAEFGWSDRHARNFMQIAETFKSEIISDLDISTTVLGMLAAPSVSDEVRNDAVEKARAGEKITVARAKEIITAAKPAAVAVAVPNPYAKEHEEIRENCKRERAERAAAERAAAEPAPAADPAPQHPATITYKYSPVTDGGCYDSSCPGGKCPPELGCERASILAARAAPAAPAAHPATITNKYSPDAARAAEPAAPAPAPKRLCAHCGMVPAALAFDGLCHTCFTAARNKSINRIYHLALHLQHIASAELGGQINVAVDEMDEIEELANLWFERWLEEDEL